MKVPPSLENNAGRDFHAVYNSSIAYLNTPSDNSGHSGIHSERSARQPSRIRSRTPASLRRNAR